MNPLFDERAQSDYANPRVFNGSIVKPRRFYKQWMLAGNPAYFFETLSREFGDFVHYRGLFSFYLVNHPALVKQVLMETHKNFDKQSVIYDRFRRAFGDGLVVAEGDRWKRQRKLMQPMFGPITVRNFFQSMVDAAEEMVSEWEIKSKAWPTFDIAEQMDRITLKIAGQALFRDGFDKVADQIDEWTKNINRYSAKPPLPIVRQFWFPSAVNRRLKQTLREFHQFIHDMIETRRQQRLAEHKQDLLTILLTATHEDSGNPMEDREIIEEVLGMIIGGHETSSAALTWTWFELHHHQSVQKKLFAEIDEVVGSRQLRIEDFGKLKYCRMVIDESLRLHPPFWFENRNTRKDLELGGTTIPRGSIVAFSRYSLHRHPTFWKDADAFVPERQDPAKPEHTRSAYTQVPFGGGPRICIGINFAIMELMVILVVVSQRFRVRIAAEDRHEMAAHLTMTPKFGLKVNLETRD